MIILNYVVVSLAKKSFPLAKKSLPLAKKGFHMIKH